MPLPGGAGGSWEDTPGAQQVGNSRILQEKQWGRILDPPPGWQIPGSWNTASKGTDPIWCGAELRLFSSSQSLYGMWEKPGEMDIPATRSCPSCSFPGEAPLEKWAFFMECGTKSSLSHQEPFPPLP